MTPAETTEELSQGDVDELVLEVERYVAAVEAFRAEGCEPAWADDEALPACWRLEWPEPAGRELLSVESEA